VACLTERKLVTPKKFSFLGEVNIFNKTKSTEICLYELINVHRSVFLALLLINGRRAIKLIVLIHYYLLNSEFFNAYTAYK